MSQEGINDRILREVDLLKASKEQKALLKSLLSIELEIYDQSQVGGLPRYIESYKQAFAKVMGL